MDEPLSIYLVNPDACNASPAASPILANLSFTVAGEWPNSLFSTSAIPSSNHGHMMILYFVFHTSTDGLPAAGDVKPINKGSQIIV